MLKIYNTLTRQKELFKPRLEGKAGLYVCGMTVYDYCHVGHARVMVVFDVVARYLRYLGYSLTYVRNVTDIDDKIIQRARDNGEDFQSLTERFIEAMHEDERALSVLPPDIEPKATQSIPEILAMIEKLIANGIAYVGSNGDVFYSVSKFSNYGRLSGKNLAELQAGERVEIEQAKQDPLDFVLWKAAKPGEPAWESPWGQGRPGWHIECSAMSTGCLGNHFDIHGGGMDLQFPHHENEIAQSEGATGEKFVNYWMHNGFVRINEEKMSKSLGNFFTVREVLKRYRSEVVRFFILTSHYRSPLNYSNEHLDEAAVALTRLYTSLRGIDAGEFEVEADYEARFREAMDDDFNTPVALSVLFDMARELNKVKDSDKQRASQLAATIRGLGGVLGILQDDAERFLKEGDNQAEGLTAEQIETLIQARIDAKKNKNWAEADKIRDQLKQQGVILEDVPGGGTNWRRE
ncbi:cysteine--tRNA ligase [Methylotuvimicrobium alcaliphilum]|uniref:Cysteine--tRNA ligase n=1 Tax=Methylotuvimicrobium alcaliphilum (strain DSM 19304 / NCIMB 14124 / VKM B-2133 / 20Z) TaxID=1091494 RepID=G4SV57_META2|nr:cysteine--tRNA ligase [Methylotuvimicrobium alcaliphilum]CCE25155.1 Cysteinyl-tRNA synthetase (Cysteine--tRNA ligase) [Methylotuvimicrobium alcaliphilum 20Z]